MDNATLLVLVGTGVKPADLGPLSETARENNLHLSVLILGETPPIPVYSYGLSYHGSFSLPEGWQDDLDALHARLKSAKAAVSTYLADQGATADVGVVSGATTDLAAAVAERAMTCDLVLLGDDLRSDEGLFNTILRAALFDAPVGVMLNGMATQTAVCAKTIFAAWKTGLPAARAVRAALPLMQKATAVTIAVVDPVNGVNEDAESAGSEVARWLGRRGCKVTVKQYPSAGNDTAETILHRARENGADLIVMGAYDHSRLRETVFGGTTRTMIAQRGLPVLLCH